MLAAEEEAVEEARRVAVKVMRGVWRVARGNSPPRARRIGIFIDRVDVEGTFKQGVIGSPSSRPSGSPADQ